MVSRLVEACAVVLAEETLQGMTIRKVAAKAGVAPATAYTYFSSKNHLVAEVFYRRLSKLEAVEDGVEPGVDRAVQVLSTFITLVADEPELASASTVALLTDDPDVKPIRFNIGLNIRQRLIASLPPSCELEVVETLEFIYAGALVRAGMGVETYGELAARVELTARKYLTSVLASQ